MFFTREDILKIQNALFQLGVKDSELPNAESVAYDDTLSIIQDGKNKQIKIKDFFNQISLLKKEGFINITDIYDKHYIMLLEAINLVPILQRKGGLVITFQDTNGDWRIYQFRGNITEFSEENKWFDLYDYRNNIIQSIVPDEEDLTASIPDENGNSLVSLKDRVYDPISFSGKGYKFIRKNIINVELAIVKISVTNPTTLEGDIYFNINNKGTNVHLSPTIHNTIELVAEAIKDTLTTTYTDYKVTIENNIVTLTRKYNGNTSPTTFEMYNTGVRVIVEDYTTISERNIITQDDINNTDTIYEIRYNFDLDGKTITIPNNCVLYFTSGKFYNGSISMDNTIVSTLYEDILSEINISGSYYNIQKYIKDTNSLFQASIDKLNNTVYPITLGFNVSPNVGVMNTSINYSVVSDGKPLIPDIMKISKQVNDNTAIVLLDTPASSGNLTTNIEGSREIFKFEVTKTGRTGKSTSTTRYLCYYGRNSEATMTAEILNTLNKVSTTGVSFNPNITTNDNDYIWLIVPSYLSIRRVTSAGFDVTLATPQTITNNLGSFKAYRTANPLTTATWNLVIS